MNLKLLFTIQAISELLLPLFQNKSWCIAFHVDMTFSCTFILLQIKLISICKIVHQDLF